ncbi:hypothetical protein BDN72DRAFT_206502 [Pluteus cervinus]|uniref:Uncharacterized protein n=1 Tax=Pluteus cervinus TaxID=181527 RepID=A0ACD3AIA8_9AGAR|nr:hypothetical protein BDN72DRAFT_206502 [Pluteus cervinus]
MSSTTSTTDHHTLSDAIKHDHKEIFTSYDHYMKSSADHDAQVRWAHQLVWAAARHTVGEEIIVYPLFERFLGKEGAQMADQDRAEHHYIKVRLAEMEHMEVGTDEYNDMMKDVMDHLRDHVQGEEDHDLPRLEPALGSDSAKYAKDFERTKIFAPTRPHPDAPNKPPFETLAGLMTAPIDKLRDAFSQFPTEEMMKQA